MLGIGVTSSLLLLCFGETIMGNLDSVAGLTVISVWLFAAILGSVTSVVRHADRLAVRLGEPCGTLILTLAVTAIEVISISTMMLHGTSKPTLVRDTLFAVVMITLNGMVGLSLLVGGWHHREQHYNLQGANSYLGVIIPLAVLCLILPSHTVSTAGPTLSTVQEAFLALMAVGLYITFLAIQTSRHRAYFTMEEEEGQQESPQGTPHSFTAHTTLLLSYMLPVVYLAEQLARPIDHLIEASHAPVALGGAIIAALVATPEAISAVRAARANRLQRSVNITLGSVLATIGLTVPTMLVIGHVTGKKLTLGLENADLVLLPLTLVMCIVTFASGRTNILQGAVHLLLFLAFLVLVFQG
ncbi:MAG TPA: calcium:proton antiporter [Verrucomicrobiae bacterium]|nr:calcium:proton antiporter [Verrucomicrobiae bacterium]